MVDGFPMQTPDSKDIGPLPSNYAEREAERRHRAGTAQIVAFMGGSVALVGILAVAIVKDLFNGGKGQGR